MTEEQSQAEKEQAEKAKAEADWDEKMQLMQERIYRAIQKSLNEPEDSEQRKPKPGDLFYFERE